MSRPWESYQALVAKDVRPPPEDLRRASGRDLGVESSPREMYTSPDFHRLELRRMWSRVWQLACRDEEIPDPGDVTVYEIGDWSILLGRGEDGVVRAFHNSCTHRGTKLCTAAVQVPKIRCPYHGFTWKRLVGLHGALAPDRHQYPSGQQGNPQSEEVWGTPGPPRRQNIHMLKRNRK